MGTRSQDLTPLAALAEPVRRRLYEFVATQSGPVDRDAAADGVGIARALAAFHLDRLAAAGLLDVVYRRRSGRTGPGAGRPAKFYLRPTDREIAVSLPPRSYDLAAEILAEGIERRDIAGAGATAGVLEAARERGERLVEQQAAGSPGGAERLIGLLVDQGYEPTRDEDGVVRLRNCPFHALVDNHRALTCSMNLAMLEAVAEGVGDGGLVPEAQPREGFCCVAFIPAATLESERHSRS
jgi:predicted ArsR family transcriptional regulator